MQHKSFKTFFQLKKKKKKHDWRSIQAEENEVHPGLDRHYNITLYKGSRIKTPTGLREGEKREGEGTNRLMF